MQEPKPEGQRDPVRKHKPPIPTPASPAGEGEFHEMRPKGEFLQPVGAELNLRACGLNFFGNRTFAGVLGPTR